MSVSGRAEEHATRGLVMTDSTFTRGALKQIEAYRLRR
jgi:hypothetical protein